jgi:hypothetical protein
MMADEIPAIFGHMAAMYGELESRAEPHENGTLRFEGSKVDAFRGLKISQGYYSTIFDSLTEMGCIEQVRRGSGGQGSVILLHHPPVFDEYTSIYRTRLTRPTPLDMIRQQVSDMQRRLPDIDLNSFLLSLDQRLTEIEERLEKGGL